MKRAQRRADKERMKRKARKLYPWHPKAHKFADHLKVCSCYGCCNERAVEGPTKQELLKDDIQEYTQF